MFSLIRFKTRLSDVFTDNSYCDVTLVSDDGIPFQAHRYVLSLFSPVLRDILVNTPHSHPLIYLRGMNHQELNSILQFLYFGETLVDQYNMDRVSQAATDLQIKLLIKNTWKPRDHLDKKENISDQEIHQDIRNKDENENTGSSVSSNAEEITNPDEVRHEKQLYRCKECELCHKSKKALVLHTKIRHGYSCYSCKYCSYDATSHKNLMTHQESVHEGIKYLCNQCKYLATNQSNLRAHQKSIHEGVKYPCSHCDYEATAKGHLKSHQKSVHEGVKYSCDKCEFQSTGKGHLKNHKKSVHEGVKHLCNQCDYQAGHLNNLKIHTQSAHEGVKYFCNQCEYQTRWKQHLKAHKDKKHLPNDSF